MQGSWNLFAPRSMLAMILLVAGCASAPAALGQTPTAEQVEVFQNLDPEQQRTVLEAMGKTGGQSGTTRSDPRVESPTTVLPRSIEDQRLQNLSPDGEPRLAAGDTLIVEFEPVTFEGQERILTERPRQPTDVLPGRGTNSATGRTDIAVPDANAPLNQQPAPGGIARNEIQREITRTKPEEAEMKRFIETVRRGNPYRLDRAGAIDLPGLGVVPIAGPDRPAGDAAPGRRTDPAGLSHQADSAAARAGWR